jgi:hypothetical protein
VALGGWDGVGNLGQHKSGESDGGKSDIFFRAVNEFALMAQCDIMSPVRMRSAAMGSKLWLFTGGAVAVSLAIVLLGIFVPSFQRESRLASSSYRGSGPHWAFWYS